MTDVVTPFVPSVFVRDEWTVFHYVDRRLVVLDDRVDVELSYALSRRGVLGAAESPAPGAPEGSVGSGDSADSIRFVERYVFPLRTPLLDNAVGRARISAAYRLLDHLWMVAGLSYFKASAPSRIRIEHAALSEADLDLHRLLLKRGLGEFCFVNGLDPELTPTYEMAHDDRCDTADHEPNAGPLVPVGGGKDSCVTIEALRAAGKSPTLVTVRRFPIIQHVITDAGLADIAVQRHLDSTISALNAAGALNGHVPATAIVSFAVMIAAVLNGHDGAVMSNERSASEGNVEYRGVSINHQWAKSEEAESAIVSALARITPELRWFSLLRPLSELDIARRFAATCERYFDSFSSCNRTQYIDANRRSDRWCGECPKCQFVYLALATVLSKEHVVSIWGAELFAESPVVGFRSLLGLSDWKPFECVGEHVECRVALAMILERPEWADHEVLVRLADDVKSVDGWPTDADRSSCFDMFPAPLIPTDYRGVIRAIA
jgi:UDP-N-acetyl-alpha-D-muramoyl-L-alanyl-L-glutamate epimerase